MSGMTTANSTQLIRTDLWSTSLKEVLMDKLQSNILVDWMTDFPDGNTFHIPSIATRQLAYDYVEDEPLTYQALDTGEWTFTINKYIASANYITEKNRQDGYYMRELEASFVPLQARAIQEHVEVNVMKEGQPKTGNPAGYQTAGSLNTWNGYGHRWVGSDTVNSKKVLSVEDFARARMVLQKANVPLSNLVAIVDPTTEFVMNTQTNLVNFSNNPRWEGIVATGIGQDAQFVKNIFGFDVYTSNWLAKCGQNQTGTSETIDSVVSGAGCVANLFFSADPSIRPFKGAWRQQPKVDSKYNMDFQREEYATTARYDIKIFRPENFITVLSDPTVIS